MQTAWRTISVVVLVLMIGCDRQVTLEDVLDDPGAYQGKKLSAQGVRVRVSDDAGKTLSFLGAVFSGKQGISSYTTIAATTPKGRSFVLIVDLRKEGLAQKMSELSTGKEEIVTIMYATKSPDVMADGDLMLVDIRRGK